MSDAQALLDRIINERGGASMFDATALGVAKRLAMMLASDGDGSAVAIKQLCELLPAKSDAPAYDLSLLSDRQLEQLDALLAVASGLKPPSPAEPRKKPLRSWRQWMADDAAVLFDALAAEEDNARRQREAHEWSEVDILACRNAVVMICPIFPARMFAEEIESARYAERKRWTEAEAARLAASAPPACDETHALRSQPQAVAANAPRPRTAL